MGSTHDEERWSCHKCLALLAAHVPAGVVPRLLVKDLATRKAGAGRILSEEHVSHGEAKVSWPSP